MEEKSWWRGHCPPRGVWVASADLLTVHSCPHCHPRHLASTPCAPHFTLFLTPTHVWVCVSGFREIVRNCGQRLSGGHDQHHPTHITRATRCIPTRAAVHLVAPLSSQRATGSARHGVGGLCCFDACNLTRADSTLQITHATTCSHSRPCSTPWVARAHFLCGVPMSTSCGGCTQ